MYTFEYDFTNPDDETDTEAASRSISNQSDLTEVLTAFRQFIQAAGFTYVVNVVAVKNDGTECAGTG